jgi:WD40 repeat protein
VLGQLDGVEDIIPNALGGPPVALYLDDTIGWYDLDHGQPAGPKSPLPFPVAQLIPKRLTSWDVFQGVVIIGRRALLFTNEDNPEQLRLHVRDIDLDHGTSTGLAVDENRDWPVWLFASDGDHVFTEDAVQTIHRRDAQTGADLTDLGQSYWGVLVSPGAVVATQLEGDVVVQLDPGSLQPVGAPFPRTRGTYAGLALSGDGHRVLEIRNVGVRLYDVTSRTELGDAFATPTGMADAVYGHRGTGVTLRQDGKAAVALSADGGVVSWDLDPAHWETKACDIAGRNLTKAEWDKHIGTLDQYHAICPQFAVTG